MQPIIDPRRGDIEDDASSPRHRSLLSLAGSLLAEISLPKLAIAFTLLMVVPGLALGIAPILAAIWVNKLSSGLASALVGFWPAILLVIVIVVGWFGGRPLFRLAEQSFWSLNSLAIQPAYTIGREALRQIAERRLPANASKTQRARLRAIASLVSGGLICGVAVLVVAAVLPHADLLRGAAGVGGASHLATVALANAIVLVGDLIPTVSHLPLPYIMGYDLYPLQTLETKRWVLDRAYEEKWLLVFEHDPRVLMGRVRKDIEGKYYLEEVKP